MGFKTVKISKTQKRKPAKKRNYSTSKGGKSNSTRKNYKKRTYVRKKKNQKNFLSKIIYFGVIFGVLLSFCGGIFVYVKYISTLPPITSLEEKTFKEASIFYDKNGEVLYTMYGDEKRTYIPYEQMSQNMVNAIVSGEDQTFFENKGFDLKGIFRSIFNYITQKSTKIEGTSTLSQQLIKNVFLSNQRKVERKIKEIYLSYQLNKTYSKEKILELYLNKISFGSNAYGLEQAALTFFDKHASEISILESTILASLPKGPTAYSPYNHYDRLMGYLYTYNGETPDNKINIIGDEKVKEYENIVSTFKEIITNTKSSKIGSNGILICGLNKNNFKNNIKIDKDGCHFTTYAKLLPFLNGIKIDLGEDQFFEYQTGRKDYILGRMLEDDKITFDEYKTAVIDGVGFKFKKYTEEINAPHFIFYIKEHLSKKYGNELLEEGGLKIYTTLDLEAQKKAEEIVKNQAKINSKFDSNNAALISINNLNGDIVAYVGGADYFNEEIDGNVNILNSKRQPGSSFKSFIYALAIDQNAIGTRTPIYDLETEFPGEYSPQNYDGKFLGKTDITQSLNYSRNIPAVKMFFLAGKQKNIVQRLKDFGINSLNPNFTYGAPLALGSGEITPLELAQGYSVFANLGEKVEINPILKVYDSKGLLVEEKRDIGKTRVLDEATAYIMTNILSNTSARPNQYWNSILSLNSRTAGAKTGTSNKQFTKNGRKSILPGDMWTVGFTPEYTTVAWAGNSDGTALSTKANGLEGAGPIWKNFMEYINKNSTIYNWTRPNSVKSAEISVLSGLLIPENKKSLFKSSGLAVNSLFKYLPTQYDQSLEQVQIDSLCGGKVGVNTPTQAIENGYYVAFRDIDSSNTTWQEGVSKWINEGGAEKIIGNVPNLVTSYSNTECYWDQEKIANASVKIKSDLVNNNTLIVGNNSANFVYESYNPLLKIEFILNGKTVAGYNMAKKSKGVLFANIELGSSHIGEGTLIIRSTDMYYQVRESKIDVNVEGFDTEAPKITITNPESGKVAIYGEQFFNLRGIVQDRSLLKEINLYIDGEIYKTIPGNKSFVYGVNAEEKIDVGSHIMTIEAVDVSGNKGLTDIFVEILGR